jgi:FtsH-binding integral membrane protein
MNEQHWQDWLVAIVGAWLVVSNLVLSYVIPETAPAALDATIFWNALVTGAAAILLGGMAIAAFTLWEEWADIAIGLWLVVSPWILGFADIQLAMWNVVLSGIVIILSAAWTLYDAREAGQA